MWGRVDPETLKKFLISKGFHRYDLCIILGRSKRTIDRWLSLGIPEHDFAILKKITSEKKNERKKS